MVDKKRQLSKIKEVINTKPGKYDANKPGKPKKCSSVIIEAAKNVGGQTGSIPPPTDTGG